MYRYCKAYILGDLRQFPGWTENTQGGDQLLPDDEICYLWDNFTVVRSPIKNEDPIFAHVTPDWKEFCEATLHFKLPDDLANVQS